MLYDIWIVEWFLNALYRYENLLNDTVEIS
jgi:hypothetical protein